MVYALKLNSGICQLFPNKTEKKVNKNIHFEEEET